MYRRSLPLFVVVLVLIALVPACLGTGDSAPEKTEALKVVHTVRGMFARAEDDVTMTVRHEEIPGYMASMTMPFTVAEPALLEGLEYGDKIEFSLEVSGDHSVVTSIVKLPEDTVLAFESP